MCAAWRRRSSPLVAAALAVAAVAQAQAQVAVPPPAPPVDSPAARQTEEQLSRQQVRRQQQPLTIVPTITIEETITDNVNLQPDATRRSDFVTQINPGFTVTQRGPRTQLDGSVYLPILIYARTGDDNNRVVPQVKLVGTVEAVERLFFVEAAAQVSQEYFTPFGARSTSIVNNPENAYLSQVYSISPYFKGRTPGGLDYELRDNNIWSNLNNTPIDVTNSYTNQVIGNLAREPLPLGWALEYDRSDVKFKGQNSQLTEIARARALYRPDVAVELSAGIGYERNDYPLAKFDDFVYSAGVRWRPTERTAVDAFWEHRFFGSSYRFMFDHRTPLTVWNVSASRNITSYPQLLAQLGSGSIVPLLLNSLFASRIPDATARLQFVQQFMQDRGLPLVLSSPINLYTQQIYLEERASATAGLIGARNSLFVNAFRLRTEPISGSGVVLPPVFDLLTNNTQVGAGAVWTYNLTATTAFSAIADYLRTAANPPLTGTTTQQSLRAIVTTPMSANTSLYAGARYQGLRSDFSDSTREIAGYVGLTHTFR